ncbi:MAG: nucleotide sugar dehydrogenase, partial [Chitinophagaceae bacterium]|nr:nucleotide sugar dehydrogenase [Chitinophagaceae bacterium]
MQKISIVGFGKIGQAMAAHILRQGWQVTAIDNNAEQLNYYKTNGFHAVEPGVEDIIQPALHAGHLQLSSDYASVSGSTAIILCIPLLVDELQQINKTPFLDCVRQIAPWLQQKVLLMVETSVPVGFCRKDIQPVLTSTGKTHGTDYLLAASPERIKSGTMLEQLQSIPRALGGLDAEAGQAALKIYGHFFRSEQLILLPGTEAAEFMKLAGMVYRDVNIALSNQLAMFAQATGLDLVDLIPLINADQEAALLQPGIGVGGHCTPVYPYFMMENFREAGLDFSLASESRRINEAMAAFAWSQLKRYLHKKKVLILGLSFRPQVKEDALSVTYTLQKVLESEKVSAELHDPYYSPEEIKAKGFDPCADIYTQQRKLSFLSRCIK